MGVSGASGITILDTQTVTHGATTTGVGPDPVTEYSGFKAATPAFGSISDGTSNVYAGATITGLYFTQTTVYSPSSGYVARQVIFRLSSEVANSGWTTLLVGTATFLRANATFNTATGYSQWTWTVPIYDPYLSEGDPFTSSTTVKFY